MANLISHYACIDEDWQFSPRDFSFNAIPQVGYTVSQSSAIWCQQFIYHRQSRLRFPSIKSSVHRNATLNPFLEAQKQSHRSKCIGDQSLNACNFIVLSESKKSVFLIYHFNLLMENSLACLTLCLKTRQKEFVLGAQVAVTCLQSLLQTSKKLRTVS